MGVKVVTLADVGVTSCRKDALLWRLRPGHAHHIL